MKKVLLSLLASIFLLVACGPLKKMVKRKGEVNITATPDPLALIGDSIPFRIAGSFPPNYFHKKVSAVVTPIMIYGTDSQELALEPFTLRGQSLEIPGSFEINYEKGGNFAHIGKIPYKPGMEQAVFRLRANGKFKKKSKILDTRDLVKGTMVTALLVDNDAKVIIAKDKFQKYYSKESKVSINYLVNRSNVRSSELSGTDVKEVKDRSVRWGATDKISIEEVNVNGYASPEGELDRNNSLSSSRSETGSKAVLKILKKNNVNVEASGIKLNARGEDWEGFKKLLLQSDITDKDKIVNVIGLKTDPLEREAEMKKVAVIYKEIKKKILPPLRRADISIISKHLNYTDAELMDIVKKGDLTELDEEQMLYASQKLFSKDIKKREMIYEAYFKKFPQDWRGPNNMGVVYFNAGDLSKAKSFFNKALEINKKDVVYNNLGAIEKKNGNIDAAIKLFEKAQGAGNEVVENMGSIYIKNGNYKSAVAAYNGINSFNSALASLLGGSTANAEKVLNKVNDPDNPKVYYLKAIVAARLGDAATAADNLKAALGRNPGLRDKADIDVEFDAIRDDVAIKAALGN